MPPSPPGSGSLVLAAIFPAIVLCIELLSGLCAGALFDPMPTIGHLLLVAAVPAVNVLLWRQMRSEARAPRWLLLAGGATIAVAASFALLFLPVMPFAFVGILFLGVGLLPFAPLIALAFAGRWARALAARDGAWRWTLGGIAIGIAALVIVDLPATATYVALGRYQGDADDRRRAVALMRGLGDRDILLPLSYGDTARATGLMSVLVSSWSHGTGWSAPVSTADARELYYRVTGAAFNAVERPGHGPGDRMRLFGWDDDQGGDAVGGRVRDLALAASRIDGSVAARDNLAYVEWTMAVRNRGAIQREARFTMALPEGAVASRATLWVNGEPREASIAARGAARAAYASVVRQSRDPLLVTTDGAGRLLVQAFPIAPNSSLKLRIGFTAPFQIARDGQRTLALPAIVERNFDLPDEVRHSVWIESDARAPRRSVRDTIGDADLLAHRPRLALPRIVAPSVVRGAVPARGKAPPIAVEQRIEREAVAAPAALMLVVDGSAGNAAAGAALAKAIDAIPTGLPVGIAVAADTPVTIAPRPWSRDHRARIEAAIRTIGFAGGQDDRAALAAGLAAVPDARATILWVHGAQPVAFAAPEPSLDQALDRLPALPTLVRYQAQAGRAFSGDGNRWFATARMVTTSGDPATDLRATLGALRGGAHWTVTRTQVSTPVTGSANLVRLWAADRIAEATGATGKPRDDAVALAHRLNLVTPVSGAVVLETDKDYAANGLPVPSSDDIPTVPEPEVWALLAILAGAGGWLVRRRRVAVFA